MRTTRTGAGNSRSREGEPLAGQPLQIERVLRRAQIVQLQLGEQEHRRDGQKRDGDVLDEVAALRRAV